jgi:hypothetical protein
MCKESKSSNIHKLTFSIEAFSKQLKNFLYFIHTTNVLCLVVNNVLTKAFVIQRNEMDFKFHRSRQILVVCVFFQFLGLLSLI